MKHGHGVLYREYVNAVTKVTSGLIENPRPGCIYGGCQYDTHHDSLGPSQKVRELANGVLVVN